MAASGRKLGRLPEPARTVQIDTTLHRSESRISHGFQRFNPSFNRTALSLIKSRKRVADHGEVFTPAWMVDATLDLVKDESERLDARLLEPACGSGNFPVRVLHLKLAAVELKYGNPGKHEIFMPTKTYPPMTVSELAAVEEWQECL